MSGKPKANNPYEFTRAAWDEMRDAEFSLSMVGEIRLDTTSQKGVWLLYVAFAAIERPTSDGVVCSWSGSWPNSMAQTFEAFLYSAVHRAVRMAEQYRLDEEKHAAGEENRR